MFWYITKVCGMPKRKPWTANCLHKTFDQDDDILRSRKIEFPFYRKFNKNAPPEDFIVKEVLLESPATRAPLHPTKGTASISPPLLSPSLLESKRISKSSPLGVVTQNCTLTADLNKVPKDQFKKKRKTTGEEYLELHYKLLVSVAAKMTFSLQVAGKKFGHVGAEY